MLRSRKVSVGAVSNAQLNGKEGLVKAMGFEEITAAVAKYWLSVDSSIISNKDINEVESIIANIQDNTISTKTTYVFLGNHLANVTYWVLNKLKNMFNEDESFKHLLNIIQLIFYGINLRLNLNDSTAIFVHGNGDRSYMVISIMEFLDMINNESQHNFSINLEMNLLFANKPTFIDNVVFLPCRPYGNDSSLEKAELIQWNYKDIMVMKMLSNHTGGVTVFTSMPPLDLLRMETNEEVQKEVHEALIKDAILTESYDSDVDFITKISGMNADYLFALSMLTNKFVSNRIYYGHVPSFDEQKKIKNKNHTMILASAAYHALGS